MPKAKYSPPTAKKELSHRVTAVLGPTNTGKTHYAVERMAGYATGMIGLPLRLLAREIFDRLVAIKGRSRVALLTGEEKILPANPRYYVTTVESMPVDLPVAFLAIDEVQLAADPQRGHIFTNRILHARGSEETLLMGSDTAAPLLRRLLPDIKIMRRPRLSTLRYTQPKKLARLPRRSAIVAFSAESVYELAETLRRKRGGAALVMGALSPRTRNAQVELFQSGEVDYLVATDAIGMGLNMDVDHVVFAELSKYDGKRHRRLAPAELGQIAGRAGRHLNDGTFSVLDGSGEELDAEVVHRIEEHDFPPLRSFFWRNARPDFTSTGALIRALDEEPGEAGLVRAPESADYTVLRRLAGDDELADLLKTPGDVMRLWDVCQVPDFRGVSIGAHASLLKRFFCFLSDERRIPHDWMARQVNRLDNVDGAVETLMDRIAAVRTWTFVSHRADWLREAAHWSHVTRQIEDRLSDALHERLVQRFVATAEQGAGSAQSGRNKVTSAALRADGTVLVDAEPVGRLAGLRFVPDDEDVEPGYPGAVEHALNTEIAAKAAALAKAPDEAFALAYPNGLGAPRILAEGAEVAALQRGKDPYEPGIRVLRSVLSAHQTQALERRLSCWLADQLDAKLGPLMALRRAVAKDRAAKQDGALGGQARGVGYRLVEAFGVLPRSQIETELKELDGDARRSLRPFRIQIGAATLFIRDILKPEATRLRLVLWALAAGADKLPDAPAQGRVWMTRSRQVPEDFYRVAGLLAAGQKAVRVDMMERLADAVRPLGQERQAFETNPDIMGLIGLSGSDFVAAMRAIGYRRVSADRSPEVPDDPAKLDGKGKEAGESEKTAVKHERLVFVWQGGPGASRTRRGKPQRAERKAPSKRRRESRPSGQRAGGRRPKAQKEEFNPAFSALAELKRQMREKSDGGSSK